ncbi:MAG TPA: FAD-dependent oxidoreductase [Candidatus Binatia bacterium]|nr:FAD-dependent oxidoreductase [Candidatus Binatia bacterium]
MTRVAVVGSGLAGFTAYQTLRRSLAPGEIAVFGTEADPAAAWRVRAAAIRQREMRSESDGHCLPTTFPGLSFGSARRRRSLRPLLESALDRYHPTVDEFLAHVERLRERSAWDESLVLRRVEAVQAVDDGFEVGGERFRHVLLAPGHPGLNVPQELRDDPRVVHSYEPHDYAPTVTVVGAGLAAATEWLNALAAGAEVVSVRRREPVRRPLNVPRQYFSRRGLAGYQSLSPRERVERLKVLLAPSYPPGRQADETLEWAAAEGRFRVEPSVNGSAWVICATGFNRGFRHDPLLARLVAEHDLETMDDWLVLDPDSTVPGLSDATRTLALAGAPAQWAFPAADTLAGARYAAHRFLRRIKACRTR